MAALEPQLPTTSGRGRLPKWSRRQLIDGIRWRIRTGAPWRDVPEVYVPWSTVYAMFRRWQRHGTWAKVLAALQAHPTPWEESTGRRARTRWASNIKLKSYGGGTNLRLRSMDGT
ncbi:transposase [Nonomuraea endophytica]|uniref:transposase n=1 Tax=Nonomuraea endophytica TaxID=714136 RepID=UPI0037C93D02